MKNKNSPTDIDNISEFHLEPTNICTLKCPGCARTRFIENWPQHWTNHSINIDQLFKFLDIDLSGKTISLCGNYGDPIYHPEFHHLVERIKQAGASVSIDTNGSYRNREWWTQLADLVDSQDTIKFSIDGLPDNFTNYRINADWESIKLGINIMTKTDCKIIWKFIPFSYNQHNLEEAEKLSIELGMDQFQVVCSDRFDARTQHLLPTVDFLGKKFNAQAQFKNNVSQTVDPKCNQGQEHFISATGHYVSCCYAADHRFYYKTEFGKNQRSYHISTTTLSQVLAAPSVINFYDTVATHSVCQYNCPSKL
jgi:organic radical activating enzyme